MIGWDREEGSIRLCQATEGTVRHIQFSKDRAALESSVSFLIDKLIDELSKGTIAEKITKSESLLPHGKALFSHLEKKVSEKAAKLTSLLSLMCSNLRDFEGALSLAEEELKIEKGCIKAKIIRLWQPL